MWIKKKNNSRIIGIYGIYETEIPDIKSNSIFDEYYDEFGNILDIICNNINTNNSKYIHELANKYEKYKSIRFLEYKYLHWKNDTRTI